MELSSLERAGMRCLEALMVVAVLGGGVLVAALAGGVDTSEDTVSVPLWGVVLVGLAAAVPLVGVVALERDLAGRASPRWRSLWQLCVLLTVLLALPTLLWALFIGGAWAS